jgi:hypothetical protein
MVVTIELRSADAQHGPPHPGGPADDASTCPIEIGAGALEQTLGGSASPGRQRPTKG